MKTGMQNFFLIILIFFSSFSLYSNEIETCFPKNDLRFPKENKSLDGVSEKEFSQLLERVNITIGPIVKQFTGKKLIIENRWDDATVDAHATRDEENNPVIQINGGLARHPLITRDALLLVLCHEVGHHLGGAPKSFRGKTNLRGWSSAEGEADYYAVSKCLPRLFNDGIETKNLDYEIDTVVLKDARTKCKDDNCVRGIIAAKSLSDLFASLKVGTKVPKILENDPVAVATTIYTHPNPQCRLDTYIAGTRCDVSVEIPFDNIDPKVGACSLNTTGARPTCWYQEADF